MMAMIDDRDEHRPPRGNIGALSVLLGLIAVCFTVNDLFAWKGLAGSRGLQPLWVLAMNLLIVGAIWGLLWLKPSRLKTLVLLAMLAFVALLGFGGVSTMVKVLVATDTLHGPWAWQTTVMLASNMLIGVGALLSMLWLKPWQGWKGSGEPVSPRTRKAKTLFGLSAIVAALGALALNFGTASKDNPAGLFSNGPVPLGIAIFAIASWLLGMGVINKWWYFSADEHERKVDDFANLIGWALFVTITPVWWVAARAGLLPQPNAMILWFAAVLVSAVGWVWRRYR